MVLLGGWRQKKTLDGSRTLSTRRERGQEACGLRRGQARAISCRRFRDGVDIAPGDLIVAGLGAAALAASVTRGQHATSSRNPWSSATQVEISCQVAAVLFGAPASSRAMTYGKSRRARVPRRLAHARAPLNIAGAPLCPVFPPDLNPTSPRSPTLLALRLALFASDYVDLLRPVTGRGRRASSGRESWNGSHASHVSYGRGRLSYDTRYSPLCPRAATLRALPRE